VIPDPMKSAKYGVRQASIEVCLGETIGIRRAHFGSEFDSSSCTNTRQIKRQMDVQHILVPPINATDVGNTSVHHILSGSFRSLSLFLLAFSPSKRSLLHLQTIPAFGPHQYLASNQHKDRIYTTSWARPPTLSSWHVERSDPWRVSHINTVPISEFVDGIKGCPLNLPVTLSRNLLIHDCATTLYPCIFGWWAYRGIPPHR